MSITPCGPVEGTSRAIALQNSSAATISAATTSTSPAAHNDLTRGITDGIVAKNALSASVRAIKAADSMVGELLDLVG